MKTFAKIVLGVFALYCFSCHRVTYESCVRELVGHKIDFPKILYKTSGDSLITQSLDNHGNMLLTWVDSSMCKPCFFQSLFRWEPLIEMGKSDTLSFDCVFIISPKKADKENNMAEFIELLPKGSKVLIDKDNYISNRNDVMRKNGIYINTYLVNSSDSIVLIGNPIRNDAIWNLYIQQIRKMQ